MATSRSCLIPAFAIAVAAASGAWGQSYPNKAIRIVATEPGSAGDFTARQLAQGLSASFGQPTIVDNRSGAIAVETVAKAPSDGYTLLFYGSTIWIDPLIRKDVSWDPLRDFSPVSLSTKTPLIVVAHPSLPASSIKELITIAKEKPDSLNYATGASGSSSHLGTELFKYMTGVKMTRVPYKGAGPALTALIGGEVQIMFANAGSASPHIKAGKLKVLGVTTAQPSDLFPEYPTVAATVPGYESVSIIGMFAPAKTSTATVNLLSQKIAQTLNKPEIKQKFLNIGSDIVGGSPEEFRAMIKTEVTNLTKVIKSGGLRFD